MKTLNIIPGFAFQLVLTVLLSFSLVNAASAHGDEVDGKRKGNEKFAIGHTNVWFKDDSRVFDPRLDWSCNSVINNFIWDFLGVTTCDFNGDGFNGMPTGQRGLRTLPLMILYPVEKKHAKRATELTVAEVLYGGSVDDCKLRYTGGRYDFISFGFGFNFSFTTAETLGGGFSDLFLPGTFISDSMLTEYCSSGIGVLAEAKPARGKFPIVTYSHGDNGTDILLKEVKNLVQSGYIVMQVAHVGDGPVYLPGPEVLGDRVPADIASRISSTGQYPIQQIFGGFPEVDSEQDIKARAEDILAVVDFANKLNASGKPDTLLAASSKKTLKRLKRRLAMDKLGFYGISNGGLMGLNALVKPEFASIYKAALIHIAAATSPPLQARVNGEELEATFGRDDVLRTDGYVYNEDALDDTITHTVPMLTYIGVEDDIFSFLEICNALAVCGNNAAGNVRPANIPTRSNLRPLHANGVVMGATGPQYLLNIDRMDHVAILLLDSLNDKPSIEAVLPEPLYKESVWDDMENFLFLSPDDPRHGSQTRYQYLDDSLITGISQLYTRTWMDIYLKGKLCSNIRNVKIRDDDGNVVVTVPKKWNNIKILTSFGAFETAGVNSAVFSNLLVGLDVKGDPEKIACNRGKKYWKH